jgi:hypothetical protein
MAKGSNEKLIFLLWSVIAVLIGGMLVGGILLVHKDDDLTNANVGMQGDVHSMQSQVKQTNSALTSLEASSSSKP